MSEHAILDLVNSVSNSFKYDKFILGTFIKSCVVEKMPVPLLRFTYLYSYNNYVKIVSASTRQTKLKKILIK